MVWRRERVPGRGSRERAVVPGEEKRGLNNKFWPEKHLVQVATGLKIFGLSKQIFD